MNILQMITEPCDLWEVEFPPRGRFRRPARERYQELLAAPHEIDNILGNGAQRLLPLVIETMREVRERVGVA